MKNSTQCPFARCAGLVLVGVLLSGSGCGPKGPDREPASPREDKAAVALPPTAATAPIPPTPPSDPQAGELIQKLSARIEDLEQREGKRIQSAEEAQTQHQEQVKALLARIGQLEGKISAMAEARVLPELALPAEPGPTSQDLDQKIRVLERKNELATEAAEAQAAAAPRLTAGSNGFSFSSADTNFLVRLRGVIQLDSHTFFGDNELSEGNDSFLLRRARPILEGTVFHDFDFQFIPDFGGSSVQIFDASLNYRFRPELQLRTGKFKSPVGLEQLQVDADVAFNERSLATDLVPNRSVGVELWGDIGEGALTYAAGIFNNSGDTRNSGNVDFSDDKEFAGRIFGRPFKSTGISWLRELGLGISGSYSQVSSNSAALPASTGGTLPGYTSAGQQQFFAYNPVVGPVVADGTHWRLSPQAYYYYGPFGLMGEYVISDQGVLNSANLRTADLQQKAWQIQAQYVLTGEDASFGTLIPKRPFTFHGGGIGAWQLVGRYGHLSIDEAAFPNFANPATSAKGATEWAVGINWWLNRNLRVLTSFSHTDFDGGGMVNLADPASRNAPATVTHQAENALFTRLQLSF